MSEFDAWITRGKGETLAQLFPDLDPPPYAAFIRWTPTLAAERLRGSNRSMKGFNLNKISTAMHAGDFVFTGDTIKFAPDGECIDGQHRLRAIINTGKSQVFLTVFNVPKSSQKFIDIGAPRTAGDFLTQAGAKNPTRIASALNIIKVYIDYHNGEHGASMMDYRRSLRNYEVVHFYNLFREINVHFEAVKSCECTNATWAAALRFLFSKVDYDLGCNFIDSVIFNVGLVKDSPEWRYNEFLHKKRKKEASIKQNTETGMMARARMLALGIKAFNHSRASYNADLRWDEGREAFPKLKDFECSYVLPHGLGPAEEGDDKVVETE